VEQRERGASGSAAARQRGKERRERWGSGCGGAKWHGGAVGPGPARRTVPGNGPSAALAADRRGWPISGRGESTGAGGPAREETETGRPDAQ
jgi:hypothetical protein